MAAAAVALLAIVGAVTWVAVAGNDDGPDPRAAQVSVHGVAALGDAAPDFSLTTFDGRAVRLSAYRGTPVVVNFWRSDCHPCRQEFPMFRRQLLAHHGEFALIGVDVKDITADGRAFFTPARPDHDGNTANPARPVGLDSLFTATHSSQRNQRAAASGAAIAHATSTASSPVGNEPPGDRTARTVSDKAAAGNALANVSSTSGSLSSG